MEARGFPSLAERDQAQAIVEELAQFPGAGAALEGALAWMDDAADASVSPGRALIPRSMLRELSAGPAGRVGTALLRAAMKAGAPKSAAVAKFAPAPSEPAEDFRSSQSFEPRARAPKPLIEEGVGADSLHAMVSALEDRGFGGTSLHIVQANRAKARRR